MRCLDLTLPTPEENLALDEALLEEAEADGSPGEVLRFWEPAAPMVVAGRCSNVDAEIELCACRELGIAVLRRISGGAAVVSGPGCLMYALVLDLLNRPRLRAVHRAHRFVLGAIVAALESELPGVQCRGTSDLAVGELKFSGNSLRVKRDHLLYHGTLLYDFPLELVSRCLKTPPRQPEYRGNRAHAAFLTNLALKAAAIRRALRSAFDAAEPLAEWPRQRTAHLVAEKYARAEWNGR